MVALAQYPSLDVKEKCTYLGEVMAAISPVSKALIASYHLKTMQKAHQYRLSATVMKWLMLAFM
jgi:hypothetical protein